MSPPRNYTLKFAHVLSPPTMKWDLRPCVYVCKSRCTRTRFQFKKTLPGEHSSEHFCWIGTHFQAFMNFAEVFFLRCFSEARKKHFRRNFRKCSRMRAN